MNKLNDVMKNAVLAIVVTAIMAVFPASSIAADTDDFTLIRVSILKGRTPEKVAFSCTSGRLTLFGKPLDSNEAIAAKSSSQLAIKSGDFSTTNTHGEFACTRGPVTIAFPHKGLRRRYDGRIIIKPAKRNVALFNVVGLEDYTAAVTAKELNVKYIEAMKAQAVAVRTYGIRNRYKVDGAICDTGACQVYKGADAKNAMSIKAAKLTHGEVLFYKDDVASIYYHPACNPDAPASVLGDNNTGQSAPASLSASASWGCSVTPAGIPGPVAGFSRITFASRHNSYSMYHKSSGIVSLMLKAATAMIPKTARAFFGDITVANNSGTLAFYGKRRSSMCQRGAVSMAISGNHYTTILKHYYPETTLRKIYGQNP